MTDVSFIVIAYNEGPRLERTLRSLSAQEAVSQYEIIVVDDRSSDTTAEVAERYGEVDPATRIVRHVENLGRGAARASGVAAARGRHVAMVDADIVLPSDWYRRCAVALEHYDAVSGIPVPDGDAQYVYGVFGFTPRPAPTTGSITGGNALFRSEVFTTVSFDKSLRNGEDVALWHALEQAGLRSQTLADLIVSHEEDKGLRGSVSWMFESGLGANRQLVRYRRLRTPDLAFFVWLGSLVAATRAAATRRPLTGATLPLAVAWVSSVGHLRRKFFLVGEPRRRVGAAAAIGTLMMSSYFAGRLAGGVGTVLRVAARAVAASGYPTR